VPQSPARQRARPQAQRIVGRHRSRAGAHPGAGAPTAQPAPRHGGHRPGGRYGARPAQDGQHFRLSITDNELAFAHDAVAIVAEARLDGIYVLRTSLSPDQLDAADTVRAYKSLAHVERAFRSLKSLDLAVRPVFH